MLPLWWSLDALSRKCRPALAHTCCNSAQLVRNGKEHSMVSFQSDPRQHTLQEVLLLAKARDGAAPGLIALQGHR